MNRCTHCGYRNDTRFYCAGCGRRLVAPLYGHASEADSGARPFVAELTAAVERIFPSGAATAEPALAVPAPVIDLTRIAAASGIVLAGGAKWCPVDGRQTARAFFTDLLLGAGASMIVAFCAFTFGELPVIAAVKMYFATFMAFSLVSWTLFPYLFGAPPAALVLYDLRVIHADNQQVRGDGMTALLLWLISLTYSLFPLLAAEYLFLMVAREHYQPLPFQLAAVRYMRSM